MLFPRTIFADKNTIWQQWRHLFSEVIELAVAILRAQIAMRLPERWIPDGEIDRLWNHVADEGVDCQASSDTLLHIAKEHWGADSEGAYTRVTIGNTARGYYGRTSSE